MPDPVILQHNGIECSWATSTVVDGFDVVREAPAIVLRATPHGTDYWQGYVSGSGHNQWDDTLGDASGVVCEPGDSVACTLSMLSGDVFVEISAFGMVAGPEGAGATLRELGATALPVLAGAQRRSKPLTQRFATALSGAWHCSGRSPTRPAPAALVLHLTRCPVDR